MHVIVRRQSTILTAGAACPYFRQSDVHDVSAVAASSLLPLGDHLYGQTDDAGDGDQATARPERDRVRTRVVVQKPYKVKYSMF